MPVDNHKTVLIAGGTGMIGRQLTSLLESRHYKVILLSHSKEKTDGNVSYWNPEKKIIDPEVFKDVNVVINLAGENIGEERWHARRKRKIINSRILSTNLLFDTISKFPNRVKLFISPSAIGIYGNTGLMIIHEDAPAANDFLGQTCQRWEAAARQFEAAGIRTVIFRFGIVLSREGGFLEALRLPMKFGICPIIGNGKQYQSWIHIDDLARMITKAIRDEYITGVYNAVAPGPLTNRNFMKLYSDISGRSSVMVRTPAFLLKILYGEMSKTITSGTRVSAEKIVGTGFVFNYPSAGGALRNILES